MSLKKGTIDIGTIIKGGTLRDEDPAVLFIDYTGEELEQWYADEVASKTQLPLVPEHEGLVSEGWNSPLEDIKDYVQKFPDATVVVGPNYYTSSGCTECYLEVSEQSGKTLTISNLTNIEKDWGDGTVDSLESHTYENYGNYILKLDNNFNGNAGEIIVGKSMFKEFRCSSRMMYFRPEIFKNMFNLKYLSINSISTSNNWGQSFRGNSFEGCQSLRTIIIPQVKESTSLVHYVTVPSMYEKLFYNCYNLKYVSMNCKQSAMFYTSNNCFYYCCSLKYFHIPFSSNGIRIQGENCFYRCISLKKIIVYPSEEVGSSVYFEYAPYGFYSCLFEKIIGFNGTGDNVFQYCHNLKYISYFDSPSHETYQLGTNHLGNCGKLELLDFSNVSVVLTILTPNFVSNANSYCKIKVPSNLYYEWISSTNWSDLRPRIIYDGEEPTFTLTSISIKPKSYNIYRSHNFDIDVIYDSGSFVPDFAKGFTLTVDSGPATVDGNTLVVNNTAQEGDEISITVTSTYDNTISDTKTITLFNKEESYTINLNEGQWVLTEDVGPNNEPIYKSDAGSYNINNGKSTSIITVNGYTLFKVMIYSDAESGYDYTEAFAADTTTPSRNSGLYTTKSNQKQWIECSYTLDGGEHTIPIMYSKDASANSGEDRGRFYIVEE